MLKAWDDSPLIPAGLTINILLYNPEDAARQIHAHVTAIGWGSTRSQFAGGPDLLFRVGPSARVGK